jgi:hypothetical protein
MPTMLRYFVASMNTCTQSTEAERPSYLSVGLSSKGLHVKTSIVSLCREESRFFSKVFSALVSRTVDYLPDTQTFFFIFISTVLAGKTTPSGRRCR